MNHLRPTKIFAWVIVIAGYIVFWGIVLLALYSCCAEAWRSRHTFLPDAVIFATIMSGIIGIVILWCWAKDYIENYYDN